MPASGRPKPPSCRASAASRGRSSMPWRTASRPRCSATASRPPRRSRSVRPTRSSTRPCSSARCARAWPWRRWPSSRRRRSWPACWPTAARVISSSTAACPHSMRRRSGSSWTAAARRRWSNGWLLPVRGRSAVEIQPHWPFNIIYSSGTTGAPKGIVQSHAMRWAHVARAENYGYGPDAVTLIATSLCSNTTLVCFFPTIAKGGCVVLAPPKFDAAAYLALAEKVSARPTPCWSRCSTSASWRAGFRALRPVVFRHQVLHQRAVPRRSSRPTCSGAGRAGWWSSTA